MQTEVEPVGGPQMTLVDGEDELYLPNDHRGARGVLTGVVLGAGAWGVIWMAVSALRHYRG